MEEDPELAEALRLSMMAMDTANVTDDANPSSGAAGGGGASQADQNEGMNVEDDDLAKAMEMAIRLSCETASHDRANDEKESVDKTKESDKMQVEEKKEKKVGTTAKPEVRCGFLLLLFLLLFFLSFFLSCYLFCCCHLSSLCFRF
jgi:hypothetical protein